MNIDWLGAFVIGLMGTGHCIGMCGGISSMISMSNQTQYRFPVTLAYNFGRISSYMVIGGIVGGSFATLLSLSGITYALHIMRLLAAVFMIVLALYIGRWWNGLLAIESVGKHIWKYVSPFTKKFLPIQSIRQSFYLGLLWGWLPCGIVYSMLTWSAVAGSALNGSLVMLCFGLGTLPSMLLVGQSVHIVKSIQNNTTFRSFSALLILIYGVYSLASTLNIMM